MSAVVLLAWVVGHFGFQARSGSPDQVFAPSELLSGMIRGDVRAVDRARQAVERDPRLLDSLVREAIAQESPYARAAGCELLFERGDSWVPLWIARVSDPNWLVRMKAIGALARIQATSTQLPQRYTPINQRDQWLLDWIDAFDAQTGQNLAAQLCEIYFDTQFVQFGQPMAKRCLSCHAGHEPVDFASNDDCAGCHQGVYDQWSGSAHAQSLSHLHLFTPDPNSSNAKPIDFSPIRGISCNECHRIREKRHPMNTDANRSRQCAYVFDVNAPPGDSCARCHASVQHEWETWRQGRQPRRADWPPGQIDLDVQGDERTCVDCHMTRMGHDQGPSPRDHRWAARRDLRFLQEAIDLHLFPSQETGMIEATMTNLAGHSFPTGTHRRVVRFEAGSIATQSISTRVSLGLKAPGPLPSLRSEPLRPGEQRVFQVPWPEESQGLSYRLIFMRNEYDPQAYTIDLFSGEISSLIGKPPGPAPNREPSESRP